MTGFKFDHEKEGLSKTLKKYEEVALRYVWTTGEKGVSSGEAWLHVSKILMEEERTISRASIIFFLNRMLEQGVLDYRTRTGKGGYHRVYYPLLDEKGYKKHLLKTIVESLMRDFPDETRAALTELQLQTA